MRCFNCGKEIPDDSTFCPYCGLDLTVQTEQQPNQQFQTEILQSNQQPQAGQYQENQQPQAEQYQGNQQFQTGQLQGNQQFQTGQFQTPPQMPGNQMPPVQKKNKNVLAIVGIAVGAAVLIVGIIIVILLLRKDSGDEKAVVDETTEATTEEATIATVADATPAEATPDEATTEEPEPTPYCEEKGLTFSELGTTGTQYSYASFLDYAKYNAGEREYIDTPSNMISSSSTISKTVANVTVSEPDEEGYVIYTIQFDESETLEAITSDNSTSWIITGNFNAPVVFDYYTGEYLLHAINYFNGIRTDEKTVESKLKYNDKDIKIYACGCGDIYNDTNNVEESDTSIKNTYGYEKKELEFIRVPQDYDGLVLAVFNGDTDKDRFENETSDKYKRSDGSGICFFDTNNNGYTNQVDDFVYFRLSDLAQPESPSLSATIHDNMDYASIEDFWWTSEALEKDPTLGGKLITDSAALNGWWEGYILWDKDNAFDCYGQEIVDIKLEPNGSAVNWTFNYSEVKWGTDGQWESKDDTPDETIAGTFNSDGTLTFDPASAGRILTINGFYTDGYSQYAVGTMTAQSGETADIFLVRE